MLLHGGFYLGGADGPTQAQGAPCIAPAATICIFTWISLNVSNIFKQFSEIKSCLARLALVPILLLQRHFCFANLSRLHFLPRAPHERGLDSDAYALGQSQQLRETQSDRALSRGPTLVHVTSPRSLVLNKPKVIELCLAVLLPCTSPHRDPW